MSRRRITPRCRPTSGAPRRWPNEGLRSRRSRLSATRSARQGVDSAKHYVYRMDHDTGFAPHVARGLCTLCGCKSTTVEAWAKPGSWVIGIGGKGTGKPDALVYALKVDAAPMLADFSRTSPRRAAYLAKKSLKPSAKILVGRHFYYLGTKAVPLPPYLRHLVIRAQGYKVAEDGDVARLDAYLAERFGRGAHGVPNNRPHVEGRRCGCGRANKAVERTARSHPLAAAGRPRRCRWLGR